MIPRTRLCRWEHADRRRSCLSAEWLFRVSPTGGHACRPVGRLAPVAARADDVAMFVVEARWRARQGAVREGATARVVVADDHPLFRGMLVRVLTEHPQLEVVGEAPDGEQALLLIAELEPDIAVLDVRMPALDGISVAQAVTFRGLGTKVLLLSASCGAELVHAALSAGAAGFLGKDADEDQLCQSVLAVARGETALAPALQSAVLARLRGGERPSTVELSPRELEVLALVAQGAPNGQIAQQLLLSAGTVKTYLQRVNEKLGTSDRSQAVAEAMRRGWLA